MSQIPRIVKSPLTNSWFVVTRYRIKEHTDLKTGKKRQYIVATTKHDVTDQVKAILAMHSRKRMR